MTPSNVQEARDAAAEADDAHKTRDRRRLMPKWMTIANSAYAVAVLAAFSYALGYAFSFGFLLELGTSPEEVGLTRPVLLIKAAVNWMPFVAAVLALLAFVIGLFLLFAWGFGRAVVFATRRSNTGITLGAFGGWVRDQVRNTTGHHVWSNSETAKRKRELLSVATGIALSVTVLEVGYLLASETHPSYGPVVLVFIASWLAFAALALVRYWASVAAALLLSLTLLLLTANDTGMRSGIYVREHSTRLSEDARLWLQWAGLTADPVTADPVTVLWSSSITPPTDQKQLLLLGHNDGVALLWDGTKLLRVPASQVVLQMTSLPPQWSS